MAEQASGNHGLAAHGAAELTSVIVDTYNAELRDKDGFVGDRASRRAFRAILDDWRERVRKNGDDPIGKADSEDISKKKLDAMTAEDAQLLLPAYPGFGPRPALCPWTGLAEREGFEPSDPFTRSTH